MLALTRIVLKMEVLFEKSAFTQNKNVKTSPKQTDGTVKRKDYIKYPTSDLGAK